MPFFSHVPIISLSALTGQRVVKLFPLIDTVFAEAKRHVPTSQLNEFLHTVTCQHPAPMYRGRSVKFSFLCRQWPCHLHFAVLSIALKGWQIFTGGT